VGCRYRVASGQPEGELVRLSARNQLNATVETVTHGEVMSTVKVALPDGQNITAAITKDAATELSFAPGDQVVVVIKATEVMLAKD
jgi:molybdate transport system regulatory protein